MSSMLKLLKRAFMRATIAVFAIACSLGLPVVAAETTPQVVLLEVPIPAVAQPGSPVSFIDKKCRFVGTLHRETSKNLTFYASLLEWSGVDTGLWSVAVNTKACGDQSIKVNLIVKLPRSPSTVEGALPDDPRGYQPGTQFVIESN